MKLTPWYPAEIKPVRVGYYDCELCHSKGNERRHFWNGTNWYRDNSLQCNMLTMKGWRGLAEEPK